MHRFFIFEPDKIVDNRAIIVSEELIHQFLNVLKFRIGERIVILDNTGFEYLCVIENISKNLITCAIVEKKKNNAEPKIKIFLYQSLPKNPEKFEFVLQKGTEVGVSEFYPLITQRTERESLHKIPRLEKILKESAEQSGRGIIPRLSNPVKFKNILKQTPNNKIVHLLAHTYAKKSLNEVRADLKIPEQINIFIGPEGGFTDEEISAAEKSGFIIFNIGPRILRSETAGIVIPAIILQVFEKI